MRWRVLALAWLLALGLWQARAGNAAQLYGGRGEDVLLEMTEAASGLFAVGTTTSTDGDLTLRTRSGRTGWAILIAEDGKRVWSYCSAHNGLARMICPAALHGGGYSLVLADEEGQRGEWILLDEDGRADSRVDIPGADMLCPDAQAHHVEQILLLDGEDTMLAVILSHAGAGTLTLAYVNRAGEVQGRIGFTGDAQGRAVMDAGGRVAWIGAEDGLLAITRFEEGLPLRETLENISLLAVTDALMQEDGSVTICAEGMRDGESRGLVLRVSRAGEVLFLRELEQPAQQLCQTETGFAVYAAGDEDGCVIFLDEDGGLLDICVDLPADALDLAAVPGGAAVLAHTGETSRKQAGVFAVFPHLETLAALEETPYEEMQAAQPTAQPQRQGEERLRVSQGYLLCANEVGGVLVTHMDGSGQVRWRTRIPIHTAADALEWLCAVQMEDGSVLLGGRYLTGSDDDARQEGVLALLDSDGVLRRIHALEGTGCVRSMEMQSDGCVALHIATGETVSAQADRVTMYAP